MLKGVPYKNTIWRIKFIKNSSPEIWHICKNNGELRVSYGIEAKSFNKAHRLKEKYFCCACKEKFSQELINYLKLLELGQKI